MINKIFSGTDLIKTTLELVEKKDLMTKKILKRFLMRAMMAGFIIGLIYTGYFVIYGMFSESANEEFHIIGKVIVSIFFGNALVFIFYTKSELLTSNMMIISIGKYYNNITMKQSFKILGLTFLGNFLGGLIIAILISWSTLFSGMTLEMLEASIMTKIGYIDNGFPGMLDLFVRAIFCNFAINIGMLVIYSGHIKGDVARIIVIFSAVFIFMVVGLEHSVANTVVFTIAYFQGVDFSILSAVINIIIALLGNFVGGGILIGTYYAYLNDCRKFQ